MSRTRLTNKNASEIVNDPYTMNDARPAEDKRGGNGSGPAFEKAYSDGSTPADWNEGQGTPQEAASITTQDEKERNDMNVANVRLAFAQQVQDVQRDHMHASKCVTAAQCALPGASDEVIAAQAADFMWMPSEAIDGTLSRMASLAADLTKSATDQNAKYQEGKYEGAGEGAGNVGPGADKKAGEETPATPEETPVTPAPEDKLASLMDVVGKLATQVEDLTKKVSNPVAAPVTAAAPSAPAPAPEENELENIQFNDPAPATGKTASVKGDSLESIFQAIDSSASFSMPSGMVRMASQGVDELDGLWGKTPDISAHF